MAVVECDPGSKSPASAELQDLIAVHGDRLLRSAYLLCGDEAEAQDLVQETFLQALRAAQRFRGDSELYTWLYGILRNLCRRHLRRRKRLLYEEQAVLSEPCEATAPDELDRNLRADRLGRALQNLSPEHREVVVLRYYEDMKIHEIAGQIGVSEGTVKSRLHYALLSLERIIPREMNLFASEGTHE